MLRVRTVLNGWPGAPGLNTFYFHSAGGEQTEDAQEAYTAVHTFWDSIKSCFPDAFTATTDQVVDSLQEDTGALMGSFTGTGPNVVTGTVGAGEFLPAQTMGVLSLRTGGTVNGQRVRGRSYIGPMAETCNGANGQMNNNGLSPLANAGIALLAPLASGGQLVVWHRPTTLVENDGAVYDVIDTVVRPIWGHLKSRRV